MLNIVDFPEFCQLFHCESHDAQTAKPIEKDIGIDVMFKKLVRKIWGNLPGDVRLRLIRAFQKKFTVSVAAIITNLDGNVLLLEHLLRPQSSGWGIPGGFINFGEQFEDAIRREIREETGVELNDLRLIRLRTIGRHVEVMFRASTSDEPRVLSREIVSFGWFQPDRLPEEMSEVQKRHVRELLGASEPGAKE